MEIAEQEAAAARVVGGESWRRGDPDYLTADGRPEGFGRRSFFVARIDRNLANALIKAHHYSGRFVLCSSIHLGVFSEGRLRGVLQFGAGVNPANSDAVVAGTKVGESIEFNRMWMCDTLPRNSESRAIAYALSFIRRAKPAVAWVQSFADERCGRWGVVYQAANFTYCGEHTSAFWRLDGEWYHNILMTHVSNPSRRGAHLQANKARAERFMLRQFRYVYFLKPAWRRRLRLKEQPFPKHAEQESKETRPATSRESGVRAPGSAPLSTVAAAQSPSRRAS